MVVATPRRQIRLPDFFKMITFPYPGAHPEKDRASKAAADWISSHEPIGKKGDTKAFFDRTGASDLAAYAFPYASYERMKVCADIINNIYVLDELSDITSAEFMRKAAENQINILYGGTGDDSPMAKISVDLRNHLYEAFEPETVTRFIDDWKETILTWVEEAEFREQKKALDFDEYKEFRYTQGAGHSMFALIEMCFGFVLPEEVLNNDIIKRMRAEVNYTLMWGNDIVSYNVEQSRGVDDTNAVAAVMRDRGLGMQEAMDFMGDVTAGNFKEYEALKAQLPSFGEALDENVKKYIYGLDCWAAGHVYYNYAVPKFFGESFEQVKKTNLITLLPLNLPARQN